MITAQEESLAMALPEIQGLLQQHYEELSMHVGRFPWVCNFQEYFRREANGQLLIITLREDGRLMGYFVGFVMTGLHYQTCLTLTMDVFYIQPGRRNVGAGAFKLFRRAEKSAKARGVQLINYGSKLHRDSGRLFQAFGMKPYETWYCKFLEPEAQ
jgi:hypothetical protein